MSASVSLEASYLSQYGVAADRLAVVPEDIPEPEPTGPAYPRLVTAEELKAVEIEAARQELAASDFCLGFATRGLGAALATEPYRTYPDGRKVSWPVLAYQRHRFHTHVRFAAERKQRALAKYEQALQNVLELTAGAGEVLWDRHQEV